MAQPTRVAEVAEAVEITQPIGKEVLAVQVVLALLFSQSQAQTTREPQQVQSQSLHQAQTPF